MSDNEQRRHPRIETQQPVWVEGQDLRVAAEARNMSQGGMFVVTEGKVPEVGSTLEITFEDPHEGKIAVRMEVVWREEKAMTPGVGLRTVDSKGMTAFERVVSRHEAEARSETAKKR